MNPEVSIITPLFNAEKYISCTIKSVLAQTFTNWEMIIINDCSVDESSRIVSLYLSDDRIKLIENDINLGVALTRNKGIQYAKGRYIAFLDADDLWASKKLEEQINFMRSNNYALTYTAYQKIDSKQTRLSKPINVSKSVSYKNLLKNNEIGCLTAIYDTYFLGKRYFIKVGHEDFVYWLQILKSGVDAFSINTPLAFYRVHSNTVSSNKLKAAKFTWNVLVNVENLGFFRSAYYFVNYAFLSLSKFLK